jgi:hypothetical protein
MVKDLVPQCKKWKVENFNFATYIYAKMSPRLLIRLPMLRLLANLPKPRVSPRFLVRLHLDYLSQAT